MLPNQWHGAEDIPINDGYNQYSYIGAHQYVSWITARIPEHWAKNSKSYIGIYIGCLNNGAYFKSSPQWRKQRKSLQ